VESTSFVPYLGRTLLRRLGEAALTLLVIAYLTIFGLLLAERGRSGLPAQPLQTAAEALVGLVNYLFHHPALYVWSRQEVPAAHLVLTLFARSAGLLGLALGLALLLGLPLGMAMATRRGTGRTLMLVLSILGISTPSFLLAMLLWVLNITLYRRLGLPPLPPTGFGWDAHMILPALVLAMRPLAQIAQVTCVALTEAMDQDFIRLAQAKGVPERLIRTRHALRSVLVPVLTTAATSLRFSLATLPVVEFFFVWPGVGLTLIEAIRAGQIPLVTDFILLLGLFFLLVNLIVEFLYPWLDPRLRQNGLPQESERLTWAQRRAEWAAVLRDLLRRLRPRRGPRERPALPPLPTRPIQTWARLEAPSATTRQARRRWWLQRLVGNPALILGTLLVLGLLGVMLWGPQLTSASPYQIHGVMMIEGKIGAPPYPPSSVFPWGTDHIGRDIQALVLYGARTTLMLAFWGMLARLGLGTLLGVLAGWWQDSWLDRLVRRAVGVWAAFPLTLFAMIIIQALGIQQGTWVFIAAICLVGWGEIAQAVRGQVLSLKPRPFIEAARVVGAGSGRILVYHILPQLFPTLIVIAVLEMGGVLMLLAELGFLNIFLGGGFQLSIAEAGRMMPVVARFSDVPEWAALLANIRDWWRSYPWMAWYPGAAFFLAILAFNLWGEGLRRLLEETHLNLARLFNRYVVAGVVVIGVLLGWALNTTAPLSQYRSVAVQFDPQRALAHIRALTAPQMAGRETGTPGAEFAAHYIADQMAAIGLLPAGENNTYIQTLVNPRPHLELPPALEIVDANGRSVLSFVYHQDFNERVVPFPCAGVAEGPVVGLVTAAEAGADDDPYGLGQHHLRDRIILVREADFERLSPEVAAGILVVAEDAADLQRRDLYPQAMRGLCRRPIMWISPQTAEILLATAGSSLAGLEALAADLKIGQSAVTAPGATVRMQILPRISDGINEAYYNVIGYIPGSGSEVQVPGGKNLDHYVVMVSAYYDGLGIAPDGTLYPGANDNASGVAALLELARLLKESPYQPKRTVVFVAWAGGERREGLSVVNVMNAKTGFSSLTVETVLELSGVAAGTGTRIALGEGSSYRLVKLIERAAGRVGVGVTTRGRGPHAGLPVEAGFGGRSALSAYISWDGSDVLAHTPLDDLSRIDPERLRKVGQTTALTLLMLSREIGGW
jgi:peptide/nickel transport system permease protein